MAINWHSTGLQGSENGEGLLSEPPLSLSDGSEGMAFTQRLILLRVEGLSFQVDLAELREREREREMEEGERQGVR